MLTVVPYSPATQAIGETNVAIKFLCTGTLTVANVKSAAEGATGGGSGTFTVSIEAVFADNYQ